MERAATGAGRRQVTSGAGSRAGRRLRVPRCSERAACHQRRASGPLGSMGELIVASGRSSPRGWHAPTPRLESGGKFLASGQEISRADRGRRRARLDDLHKARVGKLKSRSPAWKRRAGLANTRQWPTRPNGSAKSEQECWPLAARGRVLESSADV